MPVQKFTVSRDDNVYQAWPDVILTRGGRLICVFTECHHHGDRTDSRLMLVHSDDRGRTWTEKEPLTEKTSKNLYFNNARLTRMPDDSLVIVCDKSFEGPECASADTVQYIWHGDAEGENFGKPEILPFKVIVPDKLHVLKNGRILYSGHTKNPATGKLSQYLWYSDDGMKSWSGRITVASDERYNICEGSILEMPTGELICYMRENSGRGYDCMKAISRDGGASWEGVYNVPIPACHRPVSGFLADGRIMVTHRFMHGGKGWLGSWTQNVFAAFLDPATALETSRSAQSARIMPLDYDRSPVSDLGYTGWVQFDDGEIYVVNYIVDDAPKAQIRGYSFYPEDIILNINN